MKSSKSSVLTEAAQGFDDELERYAQLAEAFTKAALSTTRQLERANEAIDEIVAAEERLRGAGQKLIEAVAAARSRQEALAQGVIDRLPAIKERNAQLRELLGEMAAIGAETGALNDRAAEISKEGVESARHDPRARDLAAGMDGLQQRAATLAEKARAAEFDELANQAHSLHQRLLAAWKKLDKVAPQPS